MTTSVDSRTMENPAIYKLQKRALRFGLTDHQLAEYSANGFIILRGLFSKSEAKEWSVAADSLLERRDLIHPDNVRFSMVRDPVTNEERVWKIDQFVDLSAVFLALCRDERILDAVGSIFDGNEPRLFKDKIIYKPPQSYGSALHQDYTWWQGFPKNLLSVLISIDPATRENGCTELFPGYERGYLTKPGHFEYLRDEDVDLKAGQYVETEPGDVAIFHCLTPHRAGMNNSRDWRRQIFLSYNSAADGEHYQAHREHYIKYIRNYCEKDVRAAKYFR